jgi:predicted transcriptional regulator
MGIEKYEPDAKMKANKEIKKEFDVLDEQQKQLEAELTAVGAEIKESESMALRLRGIIGLIKSWLASIENSTLLYIKASDSAGIMMLNGKGDPLACYTGWAKCHGWTFVGVPDIIPGTWCNFTNYIQSLQDEIRQLEKYLPGIVLRFMNQIKNVKEYVIKKIKPVLLTNTELLVTKVFRQDAESVDLAYYMIYSKEITRAKLDEIYSKDSSGKRLLRYDHVSKYILEDMQLKGSDHFDYNEFGPVANSITLSKLALLDPKGLNELITANAGTVESALYGNPVYPEYQGNFTILFDAVTSIDGNHQWQPYPLPYPREVYTTIQKNSFGYNYYENPSEKKRFKIWVDPVLRIKVFLKLFNKSCLGSLGERLKANNYPFTECELNPFPSTLDVNGKPITMDSKCLKKKIVRQARGTRNGR